MSRAILAGVAMSWAFAGCSQAATLPEALIETYRTNPTLTGARADLRALDEGSAIARSASRPTIYGQLGLNNDFRGLTKLTNNGRQLTAGVQLAYPVFAGGRVHNAVNAADKRVDAGRAQLRSVEGDIMAQAVSAYMDVIRDSAIVELNVAQVDLLQRNLSANEKRLKVNDVTNTDVAQSDARLAIARSQLANVAGQLTGSREAYRQVIGSWPEKLQPPPPLPPLPPTADAAVEQAIHDSPLMAQAAAGRAAAHFDVRAAQSERLPSISATTQQSYTDYLGTLERSVGAPPHTLDNTIPSTAVGVTMNIPLYQAGASAARIRQARAVESKSVEQTIEAERAVIANVRAAFASFVAAGESIRASEAAVRANETALKGVRAENGIGSRTTLDVLNAVQELLNARVALVSAQRDRYVAGYALLNVMGRADARSLGLDVGQFYDPEANYRAAKGRISDWSDGSEPTPQATSTYGPTPVEPMPTPMPGGGSPQP